MTDVIVKNNFNKNDQHCNTDLTKKSSATLINGKFNSAKVFTSVIDKESIEQVKALCDNSAFKDSQIRMMPDVHAGAGCVIGFTANLGNKVVPNLVGCDIGCGVLVVSLGKCDLTEEQLNQLDEFIRENIPHGFDVNDDDHIVHFDELQDLKMYDHLKNVQRIHASLGTLGG